MRKHLSKILEITRKSSLGAVLEHFGEPLGAKMAQERQQERKINGKCRTLASPRGAKIELKSIKNLIKTISKRLFLDIGSKLVPKTSPK